MLIISGSLPVDKADQKATASGLDTADQQAPEGVRSKRKKKKKVKLDASDAAPEDELMAEGTDEKAEGRKRRKKHPEDGKTEENMQAEATEQHALGEADGTAEASLPVNQQVRIQCSILSRDLPWEILQNWAAMIS